MEEQWTRLCFGCIWQYKKVFLCWIKNSVPARAFASLPHPRIKKSHTAVDDDDDEALVFKHRHLLKCVVNLNVNKDGVHYLTERTGNDNLIRREGIKVWEQKKVTNCITRDKERWNAPALVCSAMFELICLKCMLQWFLVQLTISTEHHHHQLLVCMINHRHTRKWHAIEKK